MRAPNVLLVEDNRGDVVLIREAMEEASLFGEVSIVRDGVESLDFLYRRGTHARAPRPDLIVLDLKLPSKSGREVLDEIRPDPSLGAIPVVLLSSSASELELARSYHLPAECYLVKPGTYEAYLRIVRGIGAY